MATGPHGIQSSGEEEPGGLIPPYDKEGQGTPQENPISRSNKDSYPDGPGREISDEEQRKDALTDTDMEPQPTMGVGESINKSGQDYAPASKEGEKGPAGRPYGQARPDDASSVGAEETVTSPKSGSTHSSDAPAAPPGDQGG